MKKQWVIASAAVLFLFGSAMAKENIGVKGGKLSGSGKVASGDCAPASAHVDLDINNVRALLQNGGDMWWDLKNDAKYEVPKSLEGQPENPSSLFAGAIWIGGIDAQGQLKVAAATYRQTGNDYFPGPLDENASIDAATCKLWDKHFQVFGAEIDSFLALYQILGGNISSGQVPQNILNWPAYGNPYNPNVGNRNMAPFIDADANGYYDPTGGDYPVIDQSCGDKATYADQMIWWVYNDKGNVHSETGATAIGMEIQALAFAFKTNDEVNDMTFYKYKLLNKATSTLDSVFMGQWTDPDLGCYLDDYIGCDLETGMGIVYNQSAVDGGSGCVLDYGNQPPYEGIDYFKGPLDQNGHELGLSSFLYFNNDFTAQGNPENASDYYGYLSGTWKDGTPFTEGGDAYNGTTPTKFVFPGDPSDPTGWSECASNDAPGDRRIIESSGPFRLDPGATNDIVIGVVWVRPPIGTYPCPSYKLLKQADEKAQALFETCFKLTDGPPAPDFNIIELDKELILALNKTKDIETFHEPDSRITPLATPDSFFNFQGYQIYQLVNSNVSTKDYADPSQARLIFQCDIKDNVSKIVNITYDPTLDVYGNTTLASVPVLMVDGANQGITHTFQILNDAFASGDKRLVNNKTYYFSVLSYAYNFYTVADTVRDSSGNVTSISVKQQLQPYLAGRKNIHIIGGIPHITTPEEGGLVLNSAYGDGPELQRQEGTGNGIFVTDLTDQSVIDILTSPTNQSLHQTYAGAKGPVQVEVYDPKIVPSGDFQLTLVDTLGTTGLLNGSSTKWTLTNLTTGEVVKSDFTIDHANQQLIPDWGLSVFAQTARNPGGTVAEQLADNNGLLEATIEYADPTLPWLSGLVDQEGDNPFGFNWIRSGTYAPDGALDPDYIGRDDGEFYEKMIGRTWTAYGLSTDEKYLGPAWSDPSHWSTLNDLDSLVSADIVFTPDQSKWSRCIVVETQAEQSLSEGNVAKFDLRGGYSRNPDGSIDSSEKGMSWFPGYAINPETGERLNIFFGEDSWLAGQRGNDMWWNPTADILSPTFQDVWVGGKQYIYVTRAKYDSCKSFQADLISGGTLDKRNVYKKVCWVGIPLLTPGFEFKSIADGFIPTETKLSFRVTKPYKVYMTDVNENNGMPRYTFSTNDLAAKIGDLPTAVNALDTINIVPNPYYAYSGYENGQLDNRVKITNLPQKCTISIYSLDGTLVRKILRDDASITSYDWDLKNNAGIPIASGIYIIHVKADGIGERTMKWFGVLRPTDLDSY